MALNRGKLFAGTNFSGKLFDVIVIVRKQKYGTDEYDLAPISLAVLQRDDEEVIAIIVAGVQAGLL